MKTKGNFFEYSIIEYLDQFSKTEKLNREEEVIADAIYRFSNRVYNLTTTKLNRLV